jgi:hypothetical protein
MSQWAQSGGPRTGDFRPAQAQDEEDVSIIDVDLSQVMAQPGREQVVSGKFIIVPTLAFSLSDPDKSTVSGTLTTGNLFARIGSNTKKPILLQPGMAYKFDTFSRIYLVNPVAQPNKMVRLYVSVNEIIRIGAPPQQITGSIAVTENQTVQGASFFDLSPGAVGVTQIIAPAANVNGIKLRDAFITITSSSSALYADTAAPASNTDATKKTMFNNQTVNSTLIMPYPKTIPPGSGLWLATGVAGNRAQGTYDLL